jgi:glycine cleavage system H lipoate-binding protein
MRVLLWPLRQSLIERRASISKGEEMTMYAQRSSTGSRGEPNCIWMQAGVVRHKACTLGYECTECRFDRALRRIAGENRTRRLQGELPPGRRGAIVSWQERLKLLPQWKRPCLHHLKGRIAFRACTQDYLCGRCDFDQYFNDRYTVFAAVRPVDALDIGGVRLPQGFYLHRGHCWVNIEEGSTVRVGFDDFVLRVLAPFDRVEAPLMGKQLRRDSAAIGVGRGAHGALFLSPVNGVVTEMNPRLRESGCRAGIDPYTDGWVLRAHAPNLRQDLHALMIGDEASGFLEREVERLYDFIEEKAGPLAADGGRLGHDIFGHLPQLDWNALVAAFLRA